MERQPETHLSLERTVIAGTAAVVAAIVWSHTLAAVLRNLTDRDAPLAAAGLTEAAILVAVIGAASWRRGRHLQATTAAALLAIGTLQIFHPGSWMAASALLLVGPPVASLGRRLAVRLPESFDGLRRRRPVVAGLWILLALVSVLQVGRLTTYVTDHESDWYLSTRHPFYAKHECANAYFQGAELARRGEANVYDAAHYPGLTRDATPQTELVGLTPEDPYQYPPQFLLLPILGIEMTDHYPTLRSLWFGFQITLFLLLAAWAALWIGGRDGKMATLLLPLALISFPALHNFQYGQFHLTALALGLTAMIAFDSGRRTLGGVLLAVSILGKMFPALLLIPLLVQRRWKDLGSTLAWGSAITVLALIVLGTAPFVAFFDYHLPRLASGEAFAFEEAWPEVRELIVAGNQGAYGVAVKLQEMDIIPTGKTAARVAARGYALAVLLIALLAGIRLSSASRLDRAVGWLALLGLASLASTGAWADYVPATATWLLTLLAYRMTRSIRLAALLIPCWILQFFVIGSLPIGSWAAPAVMTPLSLIGAVSLVIVFSTGLMMLRAAGPAHRPGPTT